MSTLTTNLGPRSVLYDINIEKDSFADYIKKLEDFVIGTNQEREKRGEDSFIYFGKPEYYCGGKTVELYKTEYYIHDEKTNFFKQCTLQKREMRKEFLKEIKRNIF